MHQSVARADVVTVFLCGKAMTLKKERELPQIEKCLTFRPEGDDHSPNSHWDARYPYLVNPSQLPDNYRAVKGVLI